MAANKPGKEAILAAFFDEGNYSPLFTDGAVSAAFGCANGQSVYAVYQNGEPVGTADLDKTTRVLKMAAETGNPVVTFYNSTGAKLEGGLELLNANSRLTAEIAASPALCLRLPLLPVPAPAPALCRPPQLMSASWQLTLSCS